ncbi:MAG: heparinase II/III family protein [Methyloceanibacter sp.]|jgi:uncharacterized heparinase superfamily protein
MATDPLAGPARSRAQAPRGPGALRRFMLMRMASLAYPGTEAEQLLLAPQDLRTADPSFATEIYNGHLGLAGSLVELGALSPFEIAPPSDGWARELHGFGWLRHLRAAGSELSREQAKALLGDFLRLHKTARGLPWQPEVVGRRVISWLSNSSVVLDASNPQSYEIFLRALTAQLRYLSASYRDAADGAPRLIALMALVYAGLCIAEQQAVVERYLKPFCRELDRQILPDGGHISRNPSALVELLLDLLPLRQCFMARDRLPPKQLSDAIDRAMPMVRFFRLGDGTMARFNGGGVTATDSLATVLAYDDTEGTPLGAAPNSGYARMQRGTTLMLADVAAAPAASLSRTANAGCLSFEMSSGVHPVIVNCGAPSPDHDDWRMFSRSTPAHSTLTFEDSSSASFGGANGSDSGADATLTGPPNVQAVLNEESEGLELKASHEGYVTRFGVTHSRLVLLSPTGLLIAGEDKLSAPKGLKGEAQTSGGGYAVRFHLHPSVSAEMAEDERSVRLVIPNGEAWTLSANTPTIALEESVFLADERGPRRSVQVALSGGLEEEREMRIVWTIERTAAPGEVSLPEPEDGGAGD